MFFTVNAGLCEQARSTDMTTTVTKFALAMGGVVLSSIIIYAGLTIYNKFFVKNRSHGFETEILKTPKTVDDAVKFFINKNKLS